ncbi:MAG: thioredoxin domain-containing protein [Gemmatimonadales bacterium]|nr:thioredoxin domain-containing protein [Gemmatimonadales bacterium]
MSKAAEVRAWMVTLSAVVIAGVLVARILGISEGARSPTRISAVDKWPELVAASTPLKGGANAEIVLLMVTDLQCPGCRHFHRIAEQSVLDNPGLVRVAYLPYPLPYHEAARPAAQIAECISSTGLLPNWVDYVYDHQEDLGRRPWEELLREAAIPEPETFSRCLQPNGEVDRGIDSVIALVDEVGISGTPLVIMNGWKYEEPPTQVQLQADILALRDGKAPAR